MNSFDTNYYATIYPDYQSRESLPILDYVRHGWRHGRNPSACFNTLYYISKHPAILDNQISPLEHNEAAMQPPVCLPQSNEWQKLPGAARNHLADMAFYLFVKYGFFDSEFYLQMNPDAVNEADPGLHYRSVGCKEGRLCCQFQKQCIENSIPLVWDCASYEHKWTDDEIILITGLATGKWQNMALNSGMFDKNYYYDTYPEVNEYGLDGFLHYMLLGWQIGYNPSAGFNTNYFLHQYPDVKGNPICNYFDMQEKNIEVYSFPTACDFTLLDDNLKQHALEISAFEVQKRSLFDSQWYCAKYPDLANYGSSAWEHYKKYGLAENRRPSAKFDAVWYLDEYLDSDSNQCAIWHYLKFGEKNGYSTRPNDQIQVLKEENSQLFEQVYALQYKLQDIESKHATEIAKLKQELQRQQEARQAEHLEKEQWRSKSNENKAKFDIIKEMYREDLISHS